MDTLLFSLYMRNPLSSSSTVRKSYSLDIKSTDALFPSKLTSEVNWMLPSFCLFPFVFHCNSWICPCTLFYRRSNSLHFLYPAQNRLQIERLYNRWSVVKVKVARLPEMWGFVQDNFFAIGRTEHINGFCFLTDFLQGNFHSREEWL